MTSPEIPDATVEAGELLPCPFCGGEAERVDIDDGDNAGGSCICCKQCFASSNIEFGFKENFVSNWNRRALAAGRRPEITDAAVNAAAAVLLGRVNAPEQEVYAAAREALTAALAAALAPKEEARPEITDAAVNAVFRDLVDQGYEVTMHGVREALTAALPHLAAGRAEAGAAGWQTMDTAPKDGTRILAKLHREAIADMDGIRRKAFTEIREIWYREWRDPIFGGNMPWHAGDPFDSHDGMAPDHMGEGVPIAWMPLPGSALVSAPAAPIEAERTNIFAYTEPGSDFPAFISINRRGDRIVLTARSRGGQSTVDVDFPEQQLLELSKAFRPAHYGWLFLNPDTGTEWSSNHPVQSGEVDDAEDIRPATLETLHAELIEAWSALADARRGDTPPKEDAAPAAEAEPVAWMLRHKSDGNSWLYRSKKAAEAEQRPCHILTPLYAAPSASQEALREAAYDQGRRDLLNALLEPNPAVEAKLAKWADKKPDPEGRIHFDVALWITEVAEQLGIKSQEELAEIAALAQSAPVKGGE